MPGPTVPETAFTERTGIRKVDQVVAEARCIWRETPTRDIGIDGQIEHLNDAGEATGRIVAVQVKSGPSYFGGETEASVPFTPSAEHSEYWARFSLPVILVLHDPNRDMTVWADARQALRDGHSRIEVPKVQRLDAPGVLRALASDGPLPAQAMSPVSLVETMMNSRCPDAGYEISYFELLFHGLTDMCHSVYFGMDLFHELADVKAALPPRNGTFDIGPGAFDFIDSYVAFLVTHNLAWVQFDAWSRMNRQLQIVGRFTASLTPRGRALVKTIAAIDDEAGDPYRRVVQERFVAMDFTGIEDRTQHIMRFQERFLASDGVKNSP